MEEVISTTDRYSILSLQERELGIRCCHIAYLKEYTVTQIPCLSIA